MLRIAWEYEGRTYRIHSIVRLYRSDENGVIVEISGQGPMYLDRKSMDRIVSIEYYRELPDYDDMEAPEHEEV